MQILWRSMQSEGRICICICIVFVFLQILPRRPHGKQGVRRGRIGPNVDSDLTGPAWRVARKRDQGLQRCTHKCPYYSPSPRHPQTAIVLSLLFVSACRGLRSQVPKCQSVPPWWQGWLWWLKPIWVLRGRAGSQEDTKGGVASVASALELATRKQVATSEGAAHAGKGVTWRKISLCTQQVSRLRDSCPLKMHPSVVLEGNPRIG